MRWPILTLLAIVLVVAGVASGAVFRPLFERKPAAAPAPPAYTDQQVADAKAAVCTAYQKVQQALDIAGARNGGDDPTAQLAVATSSRQALDFGGRYLMTTLTDQPATSPELATPVRKLANAYQGLTIGYLDGLAISEPHIDSLRRASDQAAFTIQRLCK